MSLNHWLRMIVTIMLCAGALLASAHRHGDSPLLWLDTLNDDRQIRSCLNDGLCEPHGAPVSFGHLLQGSSWHEMRAFLQVIGFGHQGQHLFAILLDCLMLVFLFVAGQRLLGYWTGALAAIVGLLLVDSIQNSQEMLWNFTPLAFFGSMLVLLGLRIVQSTSLGLLVLSASVAALMVNVHLVASLLIPGLALACLLGPLGSIKRILVWSTCFLLILFIVSPAAWIHNVSVVLGGGWLPTADSAVVSTPFAQSLWYPALVFGLAVVGTLGFAVFVGKSQSRQNLMYLLGLVLPGVLLFLLGQAGLKLTGTDRYLLPLVPALAVGFSFGLGVLLDAIVLRLPHFLGQIASKRDSRLVKLVATAGCGVALALISPPERRPVGADQSLRFSDVLEVEKNLQKQGLNSGQLMGYLKGPEAHLLVEALWPRFPQALQVPEAPSASANVLRVKRQQVPSPLPDGWHLIGDDDDPDAVLLILGRSWLDWSSFRVCGRRPDSACRTVSWGSSISIEPGRPIFIREAMPALPLEQETEVDLFFPLRCDQPGSSHGFLMPRWLELCHGVIKQVSPPAWATRSSPDFGVVNCTAAGTVPSELVVSWKLGSSDCASVYYHGLVPFFVEFDLVKDAEIKSIIEGLTGDAK